MNREEIQALIEKYKLFVKDGNVGTWRTGDVDRETFVAEVGPHKAEIIEFFDEQKRAILERRERQHANLYAIPGVPELREARRKDSARHDALTRMVDSGSGIMPDVDAPSAEELAALEEKYPLAVFALEAEYRANTVRNYELSAIWRNAYNALLDGQDAAEVKKLTETALMGFTASHIWD